MRREARTQRVDLTERLLHLRSIPVGGAMPPYILKIIASHLTEEEFPKGAVVMTQGQPIAEFLMLLEGELSLVRGGKPIGRLKAPQTLGFLGIIAQSEGTYDAVVERDVKALMLDADVLLDLMSEHTVFLIATLRYVGERLYYDMQDLPEQALGMAPEELPITVSDRPLDLVERVLMLRRSNFFGKANMNALSTYAQQLEEIRVPEGERLWNVGDDGDHFVLLVDGTVRCAAADGRTFRFGKGNAVGGLESVANKTRWYTAVAETPLVGLLGRRDTTVDLFEYNFEMAMHFTSALANALVQLIERKAALGQQPLRVLRNVSNMGAVPVGA
jgi:CRP-like cAMP-binding protein